MTVVKRLPSLKNTYNFAKQIHEISNFEEIFCSALMPYPRSIAYEKLNSIYNFDTDILDPEKLKNLWIDNFCDVDNKTIMYYSKRILDLGRYPITIGKERN